MQHLFVLLQLFSSPVQHGEELVFIQGLHEIVQRRHLVALGDVIRVAGDENDLNGVVALPQPFGHGDPIHAAHFNVQQQNIKVAFLGIVEEKPLGRGKGFYVCRAIPFGGPAPDQRSDIVSVRLGIVTDCNFVGHRWPPSSFASPERGGGPQGRRGSAFRQKSLRRRRNLSPNIPQARYLCLRHMAWLGTKPNPSVSCADSSPFRGANRLLLRYLRIPFQQLRYLGLGGP